MKRAAVPRPPPFPNSQTNRLRCKFRWRATVLYRLDAEFLLSLLDVAKHALLRLFLGHAFLGGDVAQASVKLPFLQHLGLLLGIQLLGGNDVCRLIKDAAWIGLRLFLVDNAHSYLHCNSTDKRSVQLPVPYRPHRVASLVTNGESQLLS